MKRLIPLLAALAFATPLHAEPATPAAAQASVMSEGVVRKIDAANAKITLRHGPLANLNMPPMTMVFRAQPPELLNGIKVGDKVKFHAEDINGSFTVTAIQAAP
jgi:Cu/Ag efflux protein CusF